MNLNIKNGLPIILLGVGLIIGYILPSKQDKSYDQELERQNKELEKRIESLERAYEMASLELALALDEVENARDSLMIESQKSQYYKIRYEKVQRTPVAITGQSQLDSLLRARYRYP